jgi:hypothetical protein
LVLSDSPLDWLSQATSHRVSSSVEVSTAENVKATIRTFCNFEEDPMGRKAFLRWIAGWGVLMPLGRKE